uniref:Uncharacterized protein n=1 Tax=Chlamydomonas euryale TaxID=1486919 RepID=A0A7R9V1Q0_9CHLO
MVSAQPHAGLVGASAAPSSVPSELAALITPMTSTFQRGVAARRMAWMVRATRHPFIGSLVPVLLPAILGMLDDAAASVSVSGVHALHHLSAEALPADLLYQRDLLLDTCRRMVAGCEERLWPSVLPATIRTVQAMEGRDPCAAGYHMLAMELLTEAERSFHVKARRLPMLHHFGPLVQAMGLTTTRHLSRLMPLLLEALHAFDAPSRAAASGLVLCVMRATWERLGAHAAILWQHLLSAFCRDAGSLLADGQAPDGSPGKAAAPDASGSDCEQRLPGAPAARIFQLADRLLRQPPGSGGDCGEAAAGARSHDAACAEELARNVFLSCQLLAAFGGASMWDSVSIAAGNEAMLGGTPPAAGALHAYMCSLRPSKVPASA